MANLTGDKPASSSALSFLNAWGSSSMAPMGMATLATALHARPFQPAPMIVVPMCMLASYVNVAGLKIDAAMMTTTMSGLYFVMALRGRRVASKGGIAFWTPMSQRTSRRRLETPARRITSIAAIGLAAMNTVAGATTAVTGDRAAELEERRERNRWGMEKDV